MDMAFFWRFHPALAALCLLAWATHVVADNGPERQAQMFAPGTAAPIIAASPTIKGLGRARQHGDGSVVVSDRVSGTGSVYAKHVIIEGELSPGHSPGCIDFGINVTLTSSSTLRAEIGGITPCTQYDRIAVAGTLTISGARLEVILIDGFEPQYGDRFDIMDWWSLSGAFATIDTSAATLIPPLVWDTSELYLDGELVVNIQHFADGDLAPWDNPDGEINAADLLIAMQLVLQQRTPGPLQYAHGDMDIDGDIDLADLLKIQQLILP